MEHPDATVERVCAGIASRQWGVVTRRQLLDAGVTHAEIRRRVVKELLLPVHPGVYRLGHRAPSTEADYLAAVLAAGEGALLAGRAGGYHLGLVPGRAPAPEVVAPRRRRLHGVVTHCSRRTTPDAALWRGIPVTSVAWTLVDLAAVLPPAALARAAHEAGVRHDTGPDDVDRVLHRRPSALGRAELIRVLHGDTPVTMSVLERRFLRLLRNAGLPMPEVNQLAGGRRVDCRWPAHRLTVELDGYRYHRSRQAWERDRRRERDARARGDDFRRYTSGDITEDPRELLAELRRLLLPDRHT